MTVLSMRRSLKQAAWAAGFAFCFLGSSAQAQVGKPGLIPADSAYVVSIPDAPAFWSAWKGNAIYDTYQKVMSNPQVKQGMASFSRELATIESVLQYKLDGETLSQIISSADIYIVAGEQAGETNLGAVMAISDAEKLSRLVDLAEKAAAEAAKAEEEAPKEEKAAEEKTPRGGADDTETTSAESPISEEKYKDLTIKRFSANEDSEFYYAMTSDTLLLSTDQAEIRALVDRRGPGNTTNTLATSEQYKKASAALADKKGEAYIFGNQKAIMEMQQGGGMEGIRELTRQLSPVDYYGSSIDIEPKRISSYSHGLVSGDISSTLQGKYPGTEPLQSLGYVPEKTLFVFATSLMDGNILFKLVNDAAKAAGNDLEANLKQAEPALGFSVKNDLIPALGNEMGIAINGLVISPAAPGVEATLLFSLADKEKMQKVLTGVERLAENILSAQAQPDDETSSDKEKAEAAKAATETKVTFSEEKAGDVTIRYLPAEKINAMGLSPGYAIHDNFLIIGTSRAAIKAAVTAKSSGTNLPASEAMKSLAPTVTTSGNMFQFVNLKGFIETIEPIATAFMPQASSYIESAKVLKVAAGNSQLKGDAIVGQQVLLLE